PDTASGATKMRVRRNVHQANHRTAERARADPAPPRRGVRLRRRSRARRAVHRERPSRRGSGGDVPRPEGRVLRRRRQPFAVVRLARLRLGPPRQPGRPRRGPLLAHRSNRRAMSEVAVSRGGQIDWYAILSFALATVWLFGIGSLLALVIGRTSLRRMKARP